MIEIQKIDPYVRRSKISNELWKEIESETNSSVYLKVLSQVKTYVIARIRKFKKLESNKITVLQMQIENNI